MWHHAAYRSWRRRLTNQYQSRKPMAETGNGNGNEEMKKISKKRGETAYQHAKMHGSVNKKIIEWRGMKAMKMAKAKEMNMAANMHQQAGDQWRRRKQWRNVKNVNERKQYRMAAIQLAAAVMK
jgi:hypothetical protein